MAEEVKGAAIAAPFVLHDIPVPAPTGFNRSVPKAALCVRDHRFPVRRQRNRSEQPI